MGSDELEGQRRTGGGGYPSFDECTVVKGTGTRDYNWLKVVWYDGSLLGESMADIQKFLTCPFNFILN